jgi:membrane-bound ClpP family serine protease
MMGEKSRRWTYRILVRYTLLQLPELAVLIGALYLVRRWIDFPSFYGWIIVILWALKDAVMFLFVWRSYDWEAHEKENPLIGAKATAIERLAPTGYVQVRGELWKAELAESGLPAEKGESVWVADVRGLTLVVKRRRTT